MNSKGVLLYIDSRTSIKRIARTEVKVRFNRDYALIEIDKFSDFYLV